MLGNREVCGADRSMIKRFFRKNSKRGASKGPIIKPDSISFLIRLVTTSGYASVDWRLSQTMFLERGHVTPGLKPSSRPESRKLVKLVSGWWDNSVES